MWRGSGDAVKGRQRTGDEYGPRHADGEAFRRFWIPVALSEELSVAPDCVRGEAEDSTSIRLPSATPPARSGSWTPTARIAARRCSSAATRNAACAACTTAGSSTSTAPAWTCRTSRRRATFKEHKIAIVAYPARKRGGIVWAYMGPKDKRPPFPEFDFAKVPASNIYVSNSGWSATGCRPPKATSTPATQSLA